MTLRLSCRFSVAWLPFCFRWICWVVSCFRIAGDQTRFRSEPLQLVGSAVFLSRERYLLRPAC